MACLSVSALLYSDALTDSPPGFPASNLASETKGWGRSSCFPVPEYSSNQSSEPVVPLVPCTGILRVNSAAGGCATSASWTPWLLPKEQLYRLYEQATREPYSFLFVYYLKPKNEMFHIRFEERFALEKDADGSGAQLPGPEAVRQLH